MHSKSFSGHYDDAMLVVMRITRGVYIKEKLLNDRFYNARGFDIIEL